MYDFRIELKAPLACFPIPPYHVEKDTYRVPPVPSLQGICHAFWWEIDWKHQQFAEYIIDEVQVINPIRTVVRGFNGVTKKLSITEKQLETIQSGEKPLPDLRFSTCNDINRTQMHIVYLVELHYIIGGHIASNDENLSGRAFKRFQKAVESQSPTKMPRMGIKNGIGSCKWLKNEEFESSAELGGEIIWYDLLVSKEYNPLNQSIKPCEFQDVPMIDGKIKYNLTKRVDK